MLENALLNLGKCQSITETAAKMHNGIVMLRGASLTFSLSRRDGPEKDADCRPESIGSC